MGSLLLGALAGGLAAGLLVALLAFLIPRRRCPRCDETLPRFRKPANARQAAFGGWDCPNCGAKVSVNGALLADQVLDGSAVPPPGARVASFGGGPILLGKLVAAAGVLALLVAVFGPQGPVTQVAGFTSLALIALGVAAYWFGRFIIAANRSPREDEQ